MSDDYNRIEGGIPSLKINVGNLDTVNIAKSSVPELTQIQKTIITKIRDISDPSFDLSEIQPIISKLSFNDIKDKDTDNLSDKQNSVLQQILTTLQLPNISFDDFVAELRKSDTLRNALQDLALPVNLSASVAYDSGWSPDTLPTSLVDTLQTLADSTAKQVMNLLPFLFEKKKTTA